MNDGLLRDALKAKALALAEVARLRLENERLRARVHYLENQLSAYGHTFDTGER